MDHYVSSVNVFLHLLGLHWIQLVTSEETVHSRVNIVIISHSITFTLIMFAHADTGALELCGVSSQIFSWSVSGDTGDTTLYSVRCQVLIGTSITFYTSYKQFRVFYTNILWQNPCIFHTSELLLTAHCNKNMFNAFYKFSLCILWYLSIPCIKDKTIVLETKINIDLWSPGRDLFDNFSVINV